MLVFKILAFILLIAILYGLIFVPTVEFYYECTNCGATLVVKNYNLLPGRKIYENYIPKSDHEHNFTPGKVVLYNWLGLEKIATDY